MNLDTTIKQIQAILDEYHAEHKDRATGPLVAYTEKPPLHEAAFRALNIIGRAANTDEIHPIMRSILGGRVKRSSVYQALEYRRRHQGDVKRYSGGIWEIPRPQPGH